MHLSAPAGYTSLADDLALCERPLLIDLDSDDTEPPNLTIGSNIFPLSCCLIDKSKIIGYLS